MRVTRRSTLPAPLTLTAAVVTVLYLAGCRAGSPPVPATEGLRTETVDGVTRYTNRLINERSPYLQLHAHNPVDWYPWGPEAFERARRESGHRRSDECLVHLDQG
jgi:hypothetical protein